jgi:alkanesulfonate monooxygenase SsuD/methylene tetrahydromethanopterin reductase-like flavin-dependent oxidoreductase (luciferase family)
VGVANGYRELELEAAGLTREDRVPKMEESLEIMKRLWAGEEVTFEGVYTRVSSGRMGVTPYQKPRPPLEMAAQIGASANESLAAYMLGQIALLRGEYEPALPLLERALQSARASGMPYLQVSALCSLGTARLDISRQFVPQVIQYHTQALELLHQQPAQLPLPRRAWIGLRLLVSLRVDPHVAAKSFEQGL